MIKQKNIQKFIIIFAVGICGYTLSAQSQDASIQATLQQPNLLMGNQTQLTVQVKTTVDKPITHWFNLPDTFNHLEILQRSPVDSSIEGNTKIYHQTFTITGFDSGAWAIPPLLINAGNKKISSAPLELVIVPAKLNGNAYNDIRDIIDVPIQKTPWWYWALATLAVLAAAGLIWGWLRKRKTKPVISPTRKSAVSLLEDALQRLRQLKAQHLPEKEEWKAYYSGLTDIFRSYSDEKFHGGAMQKTTDELLMTMDQHLSKDLLSELAETLRIADAVKFAKYTPEISRSSLDIDTVEKVLKALDSLK